MLAQAAGRIPQVLDHILHGHHEDEAVREALPHISSTKGATGHLLGAAGAALAVSNFWSPHAELAHAGRGERCRSATTSVGGLLSCHPAGLTLHACAACCTLASSVSSISEALQAIGRIIIEDRGTGGQV